MPCFVRFDDPKADHGTRIGSQDIDDVFAPVVDIIVHVATSLWERSTEGQKAKVRCPGPPASPLRLKDATPNDG